MGFFLRKKLLFSEMQRWNFSLQLFFFRPESVCSSEGV